MGWSSLYVITLLTFGAVICEGISVLPPRESFNKPQDCAQGQSYWCKDIKTATSCQALKHCIQAVWEREIPIEKDKSEVCEICLDMVKQARDQLRSNETQADLKAVLDGSCMLIPIKVVQEGCLKLMEDFAVQIVDVLSSEMNPQIVCSVAGLCNNAAVHKLEEEYHKQRNEPRTQNLLTCSSCYGIVDVIKENLHSVSSERMVLLLSQVCGQTGSYSDGCMAMVSDHAGSINLFLRENIEPKPVCSLTGLCKELYHNHNKTLVRQSLAASAVDVVTLRSKGDLPCDLCTQLVQHLKNILIANTTEEEFKLVLDGLCKQMSTYKDQCLNMIEEYYTLIYSFLVTELDGKVLCSEIGLCPNQPHYRQFLRPLLPEGMEQKTTEIETINQPSQLPVERLNPLTVIPSSFLSESNSNQDKSLCALCEYLLHFIQQEITLPSNEKKIRDTVMKACDRLPRTISAECNSFVETYMNAFIALLANRIDPSQVCPSLGVCPGELIVVEYKDKTTCPLCLLAMEEINLKVKNNTVSEINDILDDLCMRDEFPNPLLIECAKFVQVHRRAIVDMVVTEFTPQESCVYIESCVAPDLKHQTQTPIPAGNIETNEIHDDEEMNANDPNTCALCEFVMAKIDQELENKKIHEEIKDVVYRVCTVMPKTLTPKCKDFIAQYADLIIELLAQELEPKQVCTLLNLCGKASEVLLTPMKRCLLCEVLMDGLRTVLTDKDVDDDINRNLRKACSYVPKSDKSFCLSLIIQLAPQIESALRTLPVGHLVCRRVHMCDRVDKEGNHLTLGGSNCMMGSSYWCYSSTTAAACGKIEFCQQEVWKALKPRRGHNKGQVIISN